MIGKAYASRSGAALELDKLLEPGRFKRRLRLLLLESAASIALICALDTRAYADCIVSGNVVDCSDPIPPPAAIDIPPLTNTPTVELNFLPGTQVNSPVTIDGRQQIIISNRGSLNQPLTATNNGTFLFDQDGSVNAAIDVDNSGFNGLVVRPGRSVLDVDMEGDENVIDNAGTFNTSLTLTATQLNGITNRAGAAINTISLTAPTNLIDNAGTFNSGLTFTNNGENALYNQPGGTVNGINSTGAAADYIDNLGTINGTTSLSGGNDVFINRATTSGNVNLGDGRDIFVMVSGNICCTVNFGAGNDFGFIADGTLQSDVQGGAGDDTLIWSGGNIVAGLDMGDGDDGVLLYELTPTHLVTGLPPWATPEPERAPLQSTTRAPCSPAVGRIRSRPSRVDYMLPS